MEKRSFFCLILFICAVTCSIFNAHEILVNTYDGETFVFAVDSSERLGDLQDKVIALLNGKQPSLFIEMDGEGKRKFFETEVSSRNQGGYLGYPRDYYTELSPEEKSDIRFIITTLANKSLIAIAVAKNDLEIAGDRIDHLHPLRFLMAVFSDEELKVGVRNIRGKGWVWSHFLGGLKDALATEMQIGNMKDEYVVHFSQLIKIDPSVIKPAIKEQKWDDFVDLLITHIPRTGNHNRYDT